MNSTTKPETVMIEISNLRFVQGYAYEKTVEAKKLVRHLRLTHGERWRDYVNQLERISGNVRREMLLPVIDETPPIWIAEIEDSPFKLVVNGVHSTLAYRQLGFDKIEARFEGTKFPYRINDGLLTLEQIRIIQ